MKTAKRPLTEYIDFLVFLIVFLLVPIWALIKHFWHGRKRTPFYYFSSYLVNFLDVNFDKNKNSKEPAGGRVVYLFNHRSWADFFIHSYLCGGETSYLSRKEVAIFMPTLNLANLFSKRLWLFNRNKKHDRETFFLWLDKMYSKSKKFNGGGLIVYPEGSRNLTAEPLSLKTGLIQYAYKRKIKVQVAICKGCEEVFSGKLKRVNKGKKLEYIFAETVDPKDYSSEEEFMSAAKKSFNENFSRIYGSSKSRPLEPVL